MAKDQLGNVSVGGYEGETFSSRCYRMRHNPKYLGYMNKIDTFFLVLAKEADHCKNSYRKEVASCVERFRDIA